MRMDIREQLPVAGKIDRDRWPTGIGRSQIVIGQNLVIESGLLDKGYIALRCQSNALHRRTQLFRHHRQAERCF